MIRIQYITYQIYYSFAFQQYKKMQAQSIIKGYKKIPIQSLEKREQVKAVTKKEKDMIYTINQEGKWNGQPTLCYQDSGYNQNRIIERGGSFRENHFFNAFGYAYAKHGDVVLIPDQIWIMISFYLSRYIDDHSEKLRKKLVKHQGVKTLCVQYGAETLEEAMAMQKDWGYFFEEVIKQIEKNTVNGVVQAFACDFSTTNKTYKTISTSLIMNSMKKLFKYEMDIGFACGINNVYMAGTRQDWVKISQKLQKMIKFDVDGNLKIYIEHMSVILQKFLQTFDGKPDVAWWNTIMTTPQKRYEYMSQTLEVEGWILNFFGMYQRQVLSGFPQMNIQVPITLINQWTQTKKQLMLVSDWVSVSKLDERTYKPDIGMTIFELDSRKMSAAELQKRNEQKLKNLQSKE